MTRTKANQRASSPSLDRRLATREVIDLTGPVLSPRTQAGAFLAARSKFVDRHKDHPLNLLTIRNTNDLLRQIYSVGDLEMIEEMKNDNFLRLFPSREDFAASVIFSGPDAFFAICKFWGQSKRDMGWHLGSMLPLPTRHHDTMLETFDRLNAIGKRMCLSKVGDAAVFMELFKRLKVKEMSEGLLNFFLVRVVDFASYFTRHSEEAYNAIKFLMSQRFYTAYWRRECLKYIDSVCLYRIEDLETLKSLKEILASIREKVLAHCPCRGRCRCESFVS